MPRLRARTSLFPFAIATATLAGIFVASVAPSASAASATFRASQAAQLHIVGGPVAAEGAAVVIAVDSKHDLHLDGIAPNTGKILWSHPYSESLISPGITPTVYAIGNNVIDIVPAGKPSSPVVNVEGVNATTGKTAWSGLNGIVVADQPSPCAGKKYLCVIGVNQDGTTTMGIVDAVSGKIVTTLNGPYRSMDADIYQSDATTPTMVGISLFGTVAWTKTVDALMGGTGFDPSFGWDLNAYGSTEVATISSTNQGHSYGLDNAKTVGFSPASGTAAWSAPGQYQCGGTIQYQSPAVLCVFHGSLTTSTKKPKTTSTSLSRRYTGLGLTMEGLNTTTGAVTWILPLKNITAIANGTAEFTDASHLLVQLASGRTALLDTSTGQTTAVPKRQVFWCTSISLFKVNENKQANPAESRVAGNTYYPCTATGKSTHTLPLSSPSTIGVTIDGVFLWASPQGLGSRTVGSAKGFA